ncbi:MAG TPA: cyclic nucleotide-binding domain-containing protein [Bacteroidota bacterium]|nr:cyclic nucleotide-binding domain-containing protein [Bacteroidota bacterium]
MQGLLEILPEYVLHWIVLRGKERRLQDKETLLAEGEKNESLFIVLDGLFGSSVSGSARVIEHFSAGTVIGETSFFTDLASPVSVVAREPSLVLEISRNLLAPKLEHDAVYAADFYRALMTVVADRLHHTSRRLSASESALHADQSKDPRVRKAQEEIDAFKKLMVHLDKEGIRNGNIAEESYGNFMNTARGLLTTCREVLGASSGLSEGAKTQIGARLQHEMLPYVLTTETADRFYSKPRGYAGDYLAIQKIYDNVPGGTGRLGPLVDRLFLDIEPSRAVRNRRTLFADEIVSTVNAKPAGPVNVMCMASGPATEVFDAFARLEDKSRLRVTLLDIDLQSLAYVDEIRAKRNLTSNITLVNENLIALYLGRSKTKVEPQDLIYSIGLIDYLNDRLVNKVLAYSYENLAPGGRVILGNFHPSNPAKEFMDYVLEWNLIHRTEAHMNRLFKNSLFGRPCTKIQFEALGINLFAECARE